MSRPELSPLPETGMPEEGVRLVDSDDDGFLRGRVVGCYHVERSGAGPAQDQAARVGRVSRVVCDQHAAREDGMDVLNGDVAPGHALDSMLAED